MRIAITGARGRVGRALRRRLLSEPKSELAPRFISRFPARTANERQGPQLLGARPEDWLQALEGIDTLVHLAAAVPRSGVPREEMRGINVDGTRILAEAARAAGVKRFVFVSTLGVHGISSFETPFTPTSPIAPSGFYAQTKYAAEQVLRGEGSAWSFELVIVRPPVVYGAGGVGEGGRVEQLARRIGRGGRLPFGQITQNRRQMIAAENLADALVLACTHPDAPGAALLPADREGISTYELLEKLAALQARTLRLLPISEGVVQAGAKLPALRGILERLTGNVEIRDTRLSDELGWVPPRSLDAALAAMIRRSNKD